MKLGIPTAALAALVISALSVPAQAEISPPKVGLTQHFQCTGPYAKASSYTVSSVENGIVRIDALQDGKAQWLKKPYTATGINLYTEYQRNDGKGVSKMSLDMELLAEYAKLKPGWHEKFNVRERGGRNREWGYDVRVGEPKMIEHEILGKIRVVPVYEKRKIWKGSYSSDLEEWVDPARGVPIAWVYKDKNGVRDCKLIGVE